MKWTGNVTEESKNVYILLVRKPNEGLGRLGYRWEYLKGLKINRVVTLWSHFVWLFGSLKGVEFLSHSEFSG
jgi:hypothetical protein